MSDRNAFGGGNPNSLYVPMSEDEQEVLHRLQPEMRVVIHGWGHIDAPKIIIGDARLSVILDLSFHKPATPQPVHFFDLELKLRNGMSLYKKRMPTVVNGQPLMVGAGLDLKMAWDIMIHHLDPKLVKMIKPGAIGLTSRRLDKDTGDATLTGNMRTTPMQRRLLHELKQGEEKVRKMDTSKEIDATLKAGHKVKKQGANLVAPDVE